MHDASNADGDGTPPGGRVGVIGPKRNLTLQVSMYVKLFTGELHVRRLINSDKQK